jgi:isochorismate synthase EntC
LTLTHCVARDARGKMEKREESRFLSELPEGLVSRRGVRPRAEAMAGFFASVRKQLSDAWCGER